VQIAMAAADLAGRLAGVEQGSVAGEPGAEAFADRSDRMRRKQGTGRKTRLVDVQHAGDVVGAAAGMHDRRALMETKDGARHVPHQLRRQFAGLGLPVEQAGLVEALHFHHCVDERAVAIEFEPAIRGCGETPCSQIKIGRGA
jgi:hypothetical protein